MKSIKLHVSDKANYNIYIYYLKENNYVCKHDIHIEE